MIKKPLAMSSLLLLLVISGLNTACAQGLIKSEILDGQTLQPSSLSELVARVQPGTVVVVGEEHGKAVHSSQQVQLLQALAGRGLKVNVGMEFLEYPFQASVDSYLLGQINEADFLAAVHWNGFGYQFYREQILFPRTQGGVTVALNAPRQLSGKIAKQGLASLTADEAALLPPHLSRGNDGYYSRFKEVMGNHVSPAALENYFMAQSLWDDTMAWKTSEAMLRDPAQVFVIIVGEFHAQYGGGLPDRLKAWGIQQVMTVVQMNTHDFTAAEIQEAITSTGPYGPRGDYLWVSDFVD